MLVLNNLVLTSGTKLYKTAAFLRLTSDEDDDGGGGQFDITACDSQHRVTDSTEMARFWLTYLGCVVEEDPRVTTSKFFNTAVAFVNTWVTDPVEKTQMYESLHSELQSQVRDFTPRSFIRDYVPDNFKSPFREYLRDNHVPMNAFEKDVQDIKGALRRKTYISDKGVRITAPESEEQLVVAAATTIIVNDRLKSVAHS